MLIEDVAPKIESSGLTRRWFSDQYIDLVFWENDKGEIQVVHLCYNKNIDEHALVWKLDSGYEHYKVDEGEPGPLKNLSPMMVDDGKMDLDKLKKDFNIRSKNLEDKVKNKIIDVIENFGIND